MIKALLLCADEQTAGLTIEVCFSSANKCLLKVGHYSAQLEQYQKAIEIYEQVSLYKTEPFVESSVLQTCEHRCAEKVVRLSLKGQFVFSVCFRWR